MENRHDAAKRRTAPSISQQELTAAVQNAANRRTRPDGSSYVSLLFADELRICETTGWPHRSVQLTALKSGIVPERYARNQQTISIEEQTRMLETHVAVIGQGGLGGAVTEILARIGIGRLTLVDGDCFEDSNLNRQLLSSTETLGRLKVEVGSRRAASINPAVELRCVEEFLSPENCNDILAGVDIAVDCLDNIPSRFHLEEGCRKAGIPMVSAAIGGTSGQVTVVFPEDPGLRLIYGEPERARGKGVETTLGTLPFAAIAMAAIECAEVVALAAGRPAQLRKKLLIADLTYHTMEKMNFG